MLLETAERNARVDASQILLEAAMERNVARSGSRGVEAGRVCSRANARLRGVAGCTAIVGHVTPGNMIGGSGSFAGIEGDQTSSMSARHELRAVVRVVELTAERMGEIGRWRGFGGSQSACQPV